MNTKKIVLCLALSLMCMPAALAQNEQGDPHAHDWYNEQVKGKIDPVTGQKIPQTNTTSATGTTTGAGSTVNDTLNQSLGSIDEKYRGQHKWFNDDLIGNWFEGIGHGDPLCVGILAVVVAGVGGFILWANKLKPAKTEDKASS